MTIYKWEDFEQEARAAERGPADPVLSLDKAREQFDGLANQVDYQLSDVGDEPSFTQRTYDQLVELCKFAHNYDLVLEDEPNFMADIKDRKKTRIELLAGFLRYAFKTEMCKGVEKANMKKIAVYRIEVDEMIDKRDNNYMERELSKLEDALKEPYCTKEKVMALSRVGLSLANSLDMDERYFKRFLELMRDAKVGKFVPIDREEILSEVLEDDEEWTVQFMRQWFSTWQFHAASLDQLKENHVKTPSP